MSEGFWTEADLRDERLAAIAHERAAAKAREAAVVDLPSVLRLASRAVDRLIRQTLDSRGVRDVSLTGLDVLGLTSTPRPVVNLADRLKMTPQSVSQAVGQLERSGLVERDRGYPDRRMVMVQSTAKGQALHAAACEAIDEALHFVADDVSDPRLVVLTEDLARVADVDRGRHPWNRW